jgi:hypothetical protein
MARKATAATTRYTLVNTQRGGVVYDRDGHSLGGGERLVVSGVDGVGQQAIECGQLSLVPISDDAP